MTPPVATPSQTIGPYLSIGVEPFEHPEVVPPATAGAFELSGRIFDGAGAPVPDAVVELWQADGNGRYVTTPAPDEVAPRWGRSLTDAGGNYRFVTVEPGPVALGSGEVQAPHAELIVFARGLLRPVRTRVYFPGDGDRRLEADPVLGALPEDRRRTLVAVAHGDELRFDVRLQGPDETVFFAC